MAKTGHSKSQVVVEAQELIAGTTKHLSGTTQVPLLGASYTPDQITSKLQVLVNLRSGVDAAKAVTKAKIVNEAAQMPALLAFKRALESYLKAAFGSSPDVLADWLRALAPARAAAITANDPYRVTRALEIALAERGRERRNDAPTGNGVMHCVQTLEFGGMGDPQRGHLIGVTAGDTG